MKKILFMIPILMLLLIGCNNKEDIVKNLVCTNETNDTINGYKLNTTYKITYINQFVKTIELEEIIISDNYEILKTFEDTLNKEYKLANDSYGGYKYLVTNKNNKVIANVTIDYNKINLKQLIIDQPSLNSYLKDNKMLVEGIKQMYTTLGAKCD